MRSFKYRGLLWEFIGALDTGKYDSLSIEEVSRHINAGTIQAFLAEHFGSDLDLSIIDPEDWAVIGENWVDIADAVSPRKFGVANKGISLLMAYTLESMQRLQKQEAGR